jgi:hypothetical protein
MLDAMKRATHAAVAIAAVAFLVTAGDAAAGGRGRGGGHHGGSHFGGAPRSGFVHHPRFFGGPLLIGAPLYYPSPYYYYPPPPYYYAPPPVYIEQYPGVPAPQSQDWYYCPNAGAYYPYVRDCAGGWQRVLPQQPAPSPSLG